MSQQFNKSLLLEAASMTEQLRLLNLQQTKNKVGLGKTLIYRLISDGEFPAPVPLTQTGSRVGWLQSEVDEYILRCVATRNRRVA